MQDFGFKKNLLLLFLNYLSNQSSSKSTALDYLIKAHCAFIVFEKMFALCSLFRYCARQIFFQSFSDFFSHLCNIRQTKLMYLTRNVLLNWFSSMKKKFEKDSNNFWHRKLTFKVRNWHFLIAWFAADVDLTKYFFMQLCLCYFI